MKIEWETFTQMQFRHLVSIVQATRNLFRAVASLACRIYYFIAETAFFPVKNTRRYKAGRLRKLRKTRDELKRRTTNGFRYKGYKSCTLIEQKADKQ